MKQNLNIFWLITHWLIRLIQTLILENSGVLKTIKIQWSIIMITGSRQNDIQNSQIFKTIKRQWNIMITGSRLDEMQNSEIFNIMKRQYDH